MSAEPGSGPGGAAHDGDGSPDTRRRAVRLGLELLEPDLRFVAEDVLGLHTRIDWVGVDAQRRAVGVVIADRDADARALTRALAHRAWLRAHIADWLKIAPDLGADPRGEVRSLLVAPGFDPETLVAAEALPPGWIELLRGPVAAGSDAHAVRLEPVGARVHRAPRVDPAKQGDGRASGPIARFRSGLTAEDIGLSDEEAARFD